MTGASTANWDWKGKKVLERPSSCSLSLSDFWEA